MGGHGMTLAIKRLQNVGWLALVFIIAILLYPLSLNVAAVHSDLVRIDRKIQETKREIGFLDAELTTRANVAQLDEWNQLLYGYEPPTADQFLEGERALANLNGGQPNVKPVMVSVSTNGITPSGEVGRPGAAASNADDESEPSAVKAPSPRVASKAEEKPEPAKKLDSEKAAKLPSAVKTAAKPAVDSGPNKRTERLAKIDEQILSDRTMKEIQNRSKEERKRR
jgi:hypothetical protein